MISLVGVTIAIISFFMIVFLFAISQLFLTKGNYLGLVIYIILPMFMVMGLFLIPIGMYRKRGAMKRTGETLEEWPVIDLNNKRYRNAFLIFSVVTAILLFASALGSYQAFHYTESVEFCGTVCHTVMEPEHTAFQNSPHARVACVECHVGSGVDWYAKSKLSGLRQVIAVIFNTYETPIPTPIRNLRPARETCEECHWPQKFYTNSLVHERHYLRDENNTQWDIHLSMKTGGGLKSKALKEGIHWHINPDVKMEYIPGDNPSEEIPWVRYTNRKTGEAHVYTTDYNPLEEGDVSEADIRLMDCMDCHNRPSHNYLPPSAFVDNAMAKGEIPTDLPGIKKLALDILEFEFPTLDSAETGIRQAIFEFYEEEYEEIFEEDKDKIEVAVAGLLQNYSLNIFPEMKVSWQVHTNNIGHMEFNGCFRCHNGEMVSDEDREISKDCNLCHTIQAQGSPGEMEAALFGDALVFNHPGDDDWEDGYCTDCHTGLNP